MRYIEHAPEAYFAEDAARVAASLQGAANPRCPKGYGAVRTGIGWLDGVPPPKVPLVYSQPRPAVAVT
jgi:hypothetical protein